MSQNHIKTPPKGNEKAKLSATLNNSLVLRLVIASVIFAAALIIKPPAFAEILMLAAAALLAGYDIALKAAEAVESGNLLDLPMVVIVTAFLSFFIGFGIEGAAVVLLYQIGMLLLRIIKEHTRKTALELLPEQEGDTFSHLQELADDEDGTHMAIESVMKASAGTVLKFAMAAAVIYAIALPLITNLGLRISIHRALTILLIATPFSVIVSIPLAGFVGLCRSAAEGAVFQDAYSMEALADASTAVFDKGGVFSDQSPKLVALHSDVMEYDAFLNFVAHALYHSRQPFAKAVAELYDQPYKLDVIKDFREIPGYGVALSISGIPVTFAKEDFLRSRGLQLPEENASDVFGTAYYMVVADKPMGKVVFSSETNQTLENLVPEMNAAGIGRCVLLTEDSREAAQDFAEMMNFSEVYADCNTGKKYQIIREIAQKTKAAVLFIYAYAYDKHSEAAVDIRVDKRADAADAVILPDAVGRLPRMKAISARVREICIENALFAFIVKAVLIFLSIIGYCNLWLAILIDFATAALTLLNSTRAAGESFRSSLRYKMGR